MADAKKISPASGKNLEKWLQEQLDAAGRHDARSSAAADEQPEDDFYKDAMEGLKQFPSTRDIYHHTRRINRELEKKTGLNHKRRPANGHLFWMITAILVILTIIILAFIVLRMRIGQI